MLSADRVREKSPLCFSSDPIVCNLSARALLMKHMEELCSYIAREPRGIAALPVSIQTTWSGAPQVIVNIGRLEAFHFVSLICNKYIYIFLKGALHYLSKYNPLTYRIRDRYCWHADYLERTTILLIKLYKALIKTCGLRPTIRQFLFSL
jgi:hypothetical protein